MIYPHFFVQVQLTHTFLLQKWFEHTFLLQKQFTHTLLSRKRFTGFFVAKTIYALRPESFCALKVAIRKVQTFWASGLDKSAWSWGITCFSRGSPFCSFVFLGCLFVSTFELQWFLEMRISQSNLYLCLCSFSPEYDTSCCSKLLSPQYEIDFAYECSFRHFLQEQLSVCPE